MKANKTQQTILITGATGGIGKHAAITLAKRGHRVFASGRNPDKLAVLAKETVGLPIEFVELDVTSQSSIAAAKTRVDDLTGGKGPDVLINNAGYGHAAPMELVDDAALRAQFETNVFGLASVTRAFVGQMRERGHGRILNVSSVGGRVAFPLMGAYTASKYAVEALSDSLRIELKPFGIDVVVIEPGPIRTDFSHTSADIAATYNGQAGAYDSVVRRSAELVAASDKISADPKVISAAIVRAIESKNPRARYIAPFWSAIALGAMNLMPTRLLDWTMRQSTGLTRAKLRPTAAL